MILEKLKLINFRNYKNEDFDFSKNINIIYGNNGQGKTNIIEAIYVLAITKSHRIYNDYKLINKNGDQLLIEGTIKKNKNNENFKVVINNNKKVLFIDNNKVLKVKDYIAKINIVIFTPNDLSLIKENPADRRRYINIELSQLSTTYFSILNDFNKLLKSRNQYLKNYSNRVDFDINYFDIITKKMINKAIYIYKMRKKFIYKINEEATKIFKDLCVCESFNIKYQSSFDKYNFEKKDIEKEILNEYRKIINKEKKYKTTFFGIQRDDIKFLLNNYEMKDYSSQGQQRIAILSFKLAEIFIFKKYKEENPILLLDDVFSELDENTKNKLLSYIDEKTQTFITTTDINNINSAILLKSNILKIINGQIEEV